jgi:MYXO-CTERM domain-containing protein
VTCPDTGAKVGIEISSLGPVECTEVRYNSGSPNQNLIVFREASWPYNDSANTLGLTTITYNAENGEIYDADMELNASGGNLSTSDRVPANGFDLLSVVTHEAGHFLGLAHATSNTSTMFASYKPGTKTLRSLSADDVLGVCAIYPDAQTRAVDVQVASTGLLAAGPCEPEPRHGFTSKCAEEVEEPGGCACRSAAAGHTRLPFGMLALVGVVAGAARRRRRRPVARGM